jgi:hypothetical protein
MAGPISPNEALAPSSGGIPEFVFTVFNQFLTTRISPRHPTANITQNEVLKKLEETGHTRAEILGRCWLDVEPLYEKAGWIVKYDKPGYNETYEPYWVFSVGK